MSSIALVAAGIEARGRLVEEQHLRLAGERARERQPLLLAAGQPARRPLAEPVEADQREQLARRAPRARRADAGGRERVADIGGRAAAQHHRPLEHDGAPRRRRRARGRPR